MIVIPFIIFKFNDMMALLGLETLPFFENLADPIDDTLTNIPIDDFAAFMTSPVTVFGIIAYIYLELSFQANYAETVTKPSLQRSDRLEAQLNILRRESTHITANVDKIREEAKKRREEIEDVGMKSYRRGFLTCFVKKSNPAARAPLKASG